MHLSKQTNNSSSQHLPELQSIQLGKQVMGAQDGLQITKGSITTMRTVIDTEHHTTLEHPAKHSIYQLGVHMGQLSPDREYL